MAYFYVKSGESDGTGGTATKQTGSFPTGQTYNFGSIAGAITTGGAGSGDYILVSDAHAYSTSGTITYSGPITNDWLYVVCVEDANCDTPTTETVSASEATTGGGDISISGCIVFDGLYFDSNDNFTHGIASSVVYKNCILDVTDFWYHTSDGIQVTYENCTLTAADTGTQFSISSGSEVIIRGGSTSGFTTQFTNGSFLNGGGALRVYGCDLSSVTGNMINVVGSDRTNDDRVDVSFEGCKINSGMSWFSETIENSDIRLTAINCAATSAAAEHAYYAESYGGTVEDDTSIYRDATATFPDSGETISLKCVTTADATVAMPFWFDFPTLPAQLSSAGENVITIYLASTTTLYDDNVWFEVIYPDGTTKNEFKLYSSRHSNILDTNGTALTTSSEAWTGLTSENKYEVAITVSPAGADCVPRIRCFQQTGTSTTVYYCPLPGLS